MGDRRGGGLVEPDRLPRGRRLAVDRGRAQLQGVLGLAPRAGRRAHDLARLVAHVDPPEGLLGRVPARLEAWVPHEVRPRRAPPRAAAGAPRPAAGTPAGTSGTRSCPPG